MKRILSAILAVLFIISLASCCYSPSRNDTDGEINNSGTYISPEDACAHDNAADDGYCSICGNLRISPPPSAGIALPVYICGLTDAHIFRVSLNSSDYSIVTTDIDVISESFNYSSSLSIKEHKWAERAYIEISVMLRDSADPSGELSFRITSSWKEHEIKGLSETSFTQVYNYKFFYATDDTHIAFSAVSVEDAQSKLP